MLRSVVERFLNTVTEREFDLPLMAVLNSRGFTDIHFTHGQFEFGKDVIAKRLDDEGLRQYAIQAKAGDIGLSDWRSIRPQVEEAQVNTLSHPNYDHNLPRVAVLVTTGRLLGGAALDAQQLAQRSRRSGALFEVWDRQQLVDWISAEPSLAMTNADAEVLEVIAAIGRGSVREQDLERISITWLSGPNEARRERLQAASILAAIFVNRLREAGRVDLAAYMALHLLRAAWASLTEVSPRPALAKAAIQLFADNAVDLLAAVKPYVSDIDELIRATIDPVAILTYPVACCRINEIVSTLALVEESAPDLLASSTGGDAAAVAVALSGHPGSMRPLSDDFAVGLIAPTMVLYGIAPDAARRYLSGVASWTLQQYDRQAGNLGLGGHGEPEDVLAERLLGPMFEFTNVARRRPSYVLTVLLDLALIISDDALYDALVQNAGAYQIDPVITAEVGRSLGLRSGDGVRQLFPRYPKAAGAGAVPSHHGQASQLPSIDQIMVSSSVRSRHSVSTIRALLTGVSPP